MADFAKVAVRLNDFGAGKVVFPDVDGSWWAKADFVERVEQTEEFLGTV